MGEFLGAIKCNRRLTHGLEEHVVGEDIEVLLRIAIGILAALAAGEGLAESALVDRVADLDRSQGQLAHDQRDGSAQRIAALRIGSKKGI